MVLVEGAHWPLVVAALTALGEPWPAALAEADLRWIRAELAAGRSVDGRTRAPGRDVLQRRWNWGQQAVRALLREPTSSQPGANQITTS